MFDFTSDPCPLSFEEAVRLFKEWGFRVEPGPQPDEVSLIIDAPDHCDYSVHPVQMLPQIAAVALAVRQRRRLACEQRAKPQPRRTRRKVR